MRQRAKYKANMAKYNSTADLVNKIKKDNSLNSFTVRALKRIASTSNNKNTTFKSVLTGYISERYKVSTEMASEAAEQFKNL